MEANQYPGPAIVNVFTTCQSEHGVADNRYGSAQLLTLITHDLVTLASTGRVHELPSVAGIGIAKPR